MKRTFLLLACILTLGTVAQAQVSIIPKGGITLSNINFDQDYPGQKSRLGYVAGLGLNFPITSDNFFSIQPELLYIQQGTKLTAGSYGLNYAQLPLLLKINFGGEGFPIYVNAGPSFGYLLNPPTSIGDFKFTDPKRLDIGLQFGGGFGVKAGPGNVLLDARYGFGITDINNVASGTDAQNKSKNNVFQFTVGYAIPFGAQ
ncbi:MAG TPA: porin family protein [Cytophagales bacterium]|jgi:hypothetical protein